jgi:hypothetical protein
MTLEADFRKMMFYSLSTNLLEIDLSSKAIQLRNKLKKIASKKTIYLFQKVEK